MHPIVDQVEFRRILGQNEIISAWTWPDENIVSIVLQTLNDRGVRLVSDVDTARINAEKLAKSVEEYTELTRQKKIAEASYTVMMEQVKSNSILAGYSNNNSEIYEYASIPITASAPRRLYILAIASIIGCFLGLILSFGISMRRDIFYSNTAQISAQKALFRKKSKNLSVSSKKSLDELKKIIKVKNIYALRDLKIEINKSGNKVIVISGLDAKIKSSNLSRILGIEMQQEYQKIAHIDFSNNAVYDRKDVDIEQSKVDKFITIDKYENFSSILLSSSEGPLDFISKSTQKNLVEDLFSEFDLVIMSAEKQDTLSLARFITMQKYIILF